MLTRDYQNYCRRLLIQFYNSLETPRFYLAAGMLNFIAKAIPAAGIRTQFYDTMNYFSRWQRESNSQPIDYKSIALPD